MSDIISIFAFISTIIFSISQIYIVYLVKRNLKEGLKMTSSFSILSCLIYQLIWFIERDILNYNETSNSRKNIVKIFSSIFNVLMYVTPGFNIFKFFKELDFDYIILPISIVGLINSFIWLLYGIISNDKDNKYPYIYSNILGISICFIQLILYFVFKKSKLEIKISKDKLISDRDSNSTKSKKRKSKKRKKTKVDKTEKKEENDDILDII